ncbi:MAG TPA: histidinol-phosphate transaminase [Candidatus Dormibacteraeota bacterium]|nr:histidinol-phosphate transaminase [Candidatus Dormibacteraeota bacterium]
MSRFFDLVSKPAREMAGHVPNQTASSPVVDTEPKLIRLDSNENPLGPSPRAVEAMRAALAASNSYPDNDCSELRDRLAAHHEVPPEQILVTAGSTGMLGLLCQTLLAPGLNAVTSERSFIVYGMAVHAMGAQLIETPMRDHSFDLDAIQDAINEETRIVFLANPNNPTGTLLEAAAIDKFLAEVPGHVVVVLDEAYYEFAAYFAARRNTEYSRSLDYLRKGACVLVLRTFSKAHGLAGLRIGYGMGPAELMAYCARMRNTFSVSSVAHAAALAALDDQNHIARTLSNNSEQAQVLGIALSEMGYTVLPTWANFLYCDVGDDAARFAQRLHDEGISVRPLGAWGAPSCVRVSIGTAEQNRAFLNAVARTPAKTSSTG